MREREELVKAPKLGARVAHFFFCIHRNIFWCWFWWRWLFIRRGGGGGGGGGLRFSGGFLRSLIILRSRRILSDIGLDLIMRTSRWTEARCACHDVQESSNVRHCKLLIEVLCNNEKKDMENVAGKRKRKWKH